MKKFLLWLCSCLCLVGVILWQIFSDGTSYYVISCAVMILSMLPFIFSFERSKPSASELSLIASLIAIAVVSRAAFYLIPQFKPIGAVVIVSGICLGARGGYMVGVFSVFLSNFIFGQGAWTPFQMVALGIVGLLAGALFKHIKPNKIAITVYGFISTFALYGLIVDLSSVLLLTGTPTLSSVLAVYGAGVVASLVFGIATAVFLFAFGEDFIKKITRIKTKYGV